MKKLIYVARSFDGNTDAYKVFFNKQDALDAACEYYYHLTPAERNKNVVSIEGYLVKVPDKDKRTAKRIYDDKCAADSPDVMNAVEYEEIKEI